MTGPFDGGNFARRRAEKENKAAEARFSGMKLTDYGNAERLVARYRDQIRHCPQRKLWLTWDGKRWAWDETGEVQRLAKKTTRAIYSEAEHAKDQDQARAIGRHAGASESHFRISAMVALAQTEPGMPLLATGLDCDPWLLNVQNGTLHLRTGELRPHSRADHITKISSASYDAKAKSALWDKFLAQATGGDAELAAYLQRAVGYALQGNVTEKAFWFLYGAPDGMKSTFIDSVSAALGDYAVTVSFSTWLVQTNVGGNRGDLVSLMGARLVTSVEVRKGVKFDEEIIKRVTGGDMIEAAAKYEKEVRFLPSFALWLAANDAPTIRDDDEGAWSRVRRIPFNHPLPAGQRDPLMREKLRAPEVQSAILAWAVEGCLAWQKSGLGTSAAIDESTASYRRDNDRTAGFFQDNCAFESEAKVSASDLRRAYEDWCKEEGVRHPLNGNDLGERLVKRGCQPLKSNGRRIWKGVRLLERWEDPTQPAGENGGQSTGSAGSPGAPFSVNFSTREGQEKVTGKPCPGDPADPAQSDLFDEEEREAIQNERPG